MRKFLCTASAVLCAGLLAVVAAPASASTTSTFEATFQHHFGAGVAPLPCPPGPHICETGTVAGYGEATNNITITSYQRIDDTDCFSTTATGTITLADGSTLSYDASGTRCTIGSSHEAPGSQVSYGNPWSALGTFTITGGTGVFADASGSGTLLDYFAGDVEITAFTGTITLP